MRKWAARAFIASFWLWFTVETWDAILAEWPDNLE